MIYIKAVTNDLNRRENYHEYFDYFGDIDKNVAKFLCVISKNTPEKFKNLLLTLKDFTLKD